MNSRQITGTVNVWHCGIAESASDIYTLPPEQAIRALTFTSANMGARQGWRHMGTAQVTVTLMPIEDLQRGRLELLTDALDQMRAEHQAAEKLLEQQIKNLKAKELEHA